MKDNTRILIVEDKPNNKMLITNIFTKYGYDIRKIVQTEHGG
jgi:CheY-like chemotaxis protein